MMNVNPLKSATGAPPIMVAPTGARRGRDTHSGLPLTITEIAVAAAGAHSAGADAIHLHVRDAEGRHSLDAGLYREAIAAVRAAAPDLVIQITTESGGIFGPESQLRCLEALRPAAASLAPREALSDPAMAARIYALADEAGISLQHILYDGADVARLARARAEGIVPEHMRSAIFVLGAYDPPRDGAPADPPPLLDAADGLGLDWMVCAFGGAELACVTEAMRRGGGARVGFENNLLRPDGRPAADNAELVALAVEARRAIMAEKERA